MKKILMLMVLGVFLLSGALLWASGDGQEQEEYDEDTYGPQDPIVLVKPVKSVVFEHKVHTMQAGLDCDSCHIRVRGHARMLGADVATEKAH